MAGIDVSKYAHSAVHNAVIRKDYAGLETILSALPCLEKPDEIRTEEQSLAEEEKADRISAVVDRRDVPNRDTPLHLAVKLVDETATEMLMIVGADWSLRNEQGWSPLQEAICNRQESIAMIIVRHYPQLAWAKWCRRLPRLVGTMQRMRDFYMEITFHFESSVIPFISRIAPSDTYKIWKRGANLRADMTLAGFDGLRIQRSDQSIIFLGDGTEDGRAHPGSLCMIKHKDKEVINAFEFDGAGFQSTDEEIQQEVVAMSRTNILRPGINVSQAVLLPQLSWRRQEKIEMVGAWKAKVYDMHNVVFFIKSRRVPGAMTEEEFLAACNENESETEEFDEILTEDEKKQLEVALKSDPPEMPNENGNAVVENQRTEETKQEKKGWFSVRKKRETIATSEKESDLAADSPSGTQIKPGKQSAENVARDDNRKIKDSRSSTSTSSESGNQRKDNGQNNEFRKGLRPVLWLSPDFPLQIEEFLPLLDILANKVKAIHRLRELLTTKLPPGTFPVKVAFPVVPTVRVLICFTKFEELQPAGDEFSTPPSSPRSGQESSPMTRPTSSSWLQWMRLSNPRLSSSNQSGNKMEHPQDPFAIPQDYTWVTAQEMKERMQEEQSKLAKKSKSQNPKAPDTKQSNKK